MPALKQDRQWSRAFAIQANADLQLWYSLSGWNVPICQRLHFLQMAYEKLSKAFLLNEGSIGPQLQSSHAYIAKPLPRILNFVKKNITQDDIRHFRYLAREIELLAPSVDDNGRRPDNCEYPWIDAAGIVHSPTEHTFPIVFDLLMRPAGRHFLKLVQSAIEWILQATSEN